MVERLAVYFVCFPVGHPAFIRAVFLSPGQRLVTDRADTFGTPDVGFNCAGRKVQGGRNIGYSLSFRTGPYYFFC